MWSYGGEAGMGGTGRRLDIIESGKELSIIEKKISKLRKQSSWYDKGQI